MICPRCHKDIPDDALICCYCGRHIVIQRATIAVLESMEGENLK